MTLWGLSDGLFIIGAACFLSALFRVCGKENFVRLFRRLFLRERKRGEKRNQTAEEGGKGIFLRAFAGGCCLILSWAVYFAWTALG